MSGPAKLEQERTEETEKAIGTLLHEKLVAEAR
jgi:hypothetical protein